MVFSPSFTVLFENKTKIQIKGNFLHLKESCQEFFNDKWELVNFQIVSFCTDYKFDRISQILRHLIHDYNL